jgi:ribonuclease-3
MKMNKLGQLQAELGITFHDPKLLEQAFTHSSYVNENKQAKHNERLEFLGDAVLELAVTEYLYEHYPSRSEGELTKLRASIVCEPSLNKLAVQQHFGEYLLLGRGEESTGGRSRPAILADVFEAFIGALYLDQGFDKVVHFLQSNLFKKLQQDAAMSTIDAKSQLQEYAQQHSLGKPLYQLVKEDGPSHEKQFVIEVHLDNRVLGTGTGRTKKQSEQQAAAEALTVLHANKLQP